MKKTIIITSLAALIGTGFTPVANAFANENEVPTHNELGSYQNDIIVIDGITYDLNGDYDSYVLPDQPALPLPEISGDIIRESEIISYEDIVMIDGVAYDTHGNQIVSDSQFVTYGKLSWAAKALRAGYKSLPKSVRDKIGSQALFLGAVGVLDHYTGTLEDGLTQGFRNMGLSKTKARFLAKTVLLFTF
ncbi:hypothetical protein [Gracilibacillus sp. Marseille-QA3620]